MTHLRLTLEAVCLSSVGQRTIMWNQKCWVFFSEVILKNSKWSTMYWISVCLYVRVRSSVHHHADVHYFYEAFELWPLIRRHYGIFGVLALLQNYKFILWGCSAIKLSAEYCPPRENLLPFISVCVCVFAQPRGLVMTFTLGIIATLRAADWQTLIALFFLFFVTHSFWEITVPC